MRENIDLTSNRMFRTKGETATGWTKVFLKIHPWAKRFFSARELDERILTNSPVVLGNKSERKNGRISSKDYCECCGTYINKTPWNRTYGLCGSCHNDLFRRYGRTDKKPWQRKGGRK